MSTAFDIAKSRVREYDAVLKDHRRAMGCRDCEDFLLLGIEAFHWLERAKDSALHGAVQNAREQPLPLDAFDSLDAFYREWADNGEQALQWANNLVRDGFQVENLTAFKKCCVTAQAYLAAMQHEDLNERSFPSLSEANTQALLDMLPRP